MRKLATIEAVLAVDPIEGADQIEKIKVRGWTVVTRKGEFKVGDRCLYIEIDSAVPLSDVRFAFLGERSSKKLADDSHVHVVKTIRLKGTYSQGVVLPLTEFTKINTRFSVGEDVSDLLKIKLYEPPLPGGTGGEMVGAFPTVFASQTDAERVQNLGEYWDAIQYGKWIATEKIDGTSVTIVNDDGKIRVCSRNWEMKESDNAYWQAARLIADKIEPGWTVQGEAWGEGVQNNPLKVVGRRLSIFTVWKDRQIVPRCEWPSWMKEYACKTYEITLPQTIEEAIEQVDGIKSLENPERNAEGVVWHELLSRTPAGLDRPCFKVISNKYLLKNDR